MEGSLEGPCGSSGTASSLCHQSYEHTFCVTTGRGAAETRPGQGPAGEGAASPASRCVLCPSVRTSPSDEGGLRRQGESRPLEPQPAAAAPREVRADRRPEARCGRGAWLSANEDVTKTCFCCAVRWAVGLPEPTVGPLLVWSLYVSEPLVGGSRAVLPLRGGPRVTQAPVGLRRKGAVGSCLWSDASRVQL